TYLSGHDNATCTVLDKTISGVSISGGPAASVTVTPVMVTGDPGLKFDFGPGGRTIASSISYTITAPPSDPITDASLAITGIGSFAVTETGFPNGQSLSASNSNLNPAPITFAAVTSLNVMDARSLGTGQEIDTIENRFSETPVAVPVPKPSPLASLALLGVGLSAFGLVGRRKRS